MEVNCMYCDGTGIEGTRDCYACGGSGFYADNPCDVCDGSGWYTYDCTYCNGFGIIKLPNIPDIQEE